MSKQKAHDTYTENSKTQQKRSSMLNNGAPFFTIKEGVEKSYDNSRNCSDNEEGKTPKTKNMTNFQRRASVDVSKVKIEDQLNKSSNDDSRSIMRKKSGELSETT